MGAGERAEQVRFAEVLGEGPGLDLRAEEAVLSAETAQVAAVLRVVEFVVVEHEDFEGVRLVSVADVLFEDVCGGLPDAETGRVCAEVGILGKDK